MSANTSPVEAAKAMGLSDEPARDDPGDLAAMNSGQAWNAFCDAIRQMGANMLASEFAGSDLERAEGFRNLMGYVHQALTRTLYACTPEQPAFVRSMDDIVKVGLDNPDGINSHSVQLSDAYVYRLFGTAGKER